MIFISYWRTNETRTVRICRTRKHATPAVLDSFRIAGRALSPRDVARAESLLRKLEAA